MSVYFKTIINRTDNKRKIRKQLIVILKISGVPLSFCTGKIFEKKKTTTFASKNYGTLAIVLVGYSFFNSYTAYWFSVDFRVDKILFVTLLFEFFFGVK